METAVTPPPEADLHLLTDWAEPGRSARIGRSAVLSLITHAAAILFLLFMPETFMQPARPKEQEPLITPLVLPPLTLTQKEPNADKIVREFRSPDLTPRVKAPAGPSPEPQAAAPRKAAVIPPPPPKAAPQNALPEPPKVEISASEPKLTLPVQTPQVPQPKGPAFEDVGGTGSGAPGGVPGLAALNGLSGAAGGPGVNLNGTSPVPSSGAELPQLLSDPQGVDFRPYLAQVLAAVKRYWLSILPRTGHRGYVSVQFAIERDGTVGKVAFAQQTGDQALDRTLDRRDQRQAGPFGPLPVQYRGRRNSRPDEFQLLPAKTLGP